MATQRFKPIKHFLGLLLCLIVLTANGQYNYIQDITISNSKGIPIDSLKSYFPTVIKTDTGSFWFSDKFYSKLIRPTHEPILYNFYLGHDIYRFILLRSFHPPIIITLNKDENRFWLHTILLDKIPHQAYTSIETRKNKTDTIFHVERTANILEDKNKILSEMEWNKFEQLLSECDFWHMEPSIDDVGLDGSIWITEAHQKNKYWIVDRWSPNNNYKKCGEYLIKLSGYKGKIY